MPIRLSCKESNRSSLDLLAVCVIDPDHFRQHLPLSKSGSVVKFSVADKKMSGKSLTKDNERDNVNDQKNFLLCLLIRLIHWKNRELFPIFEISLFKCSKIAFASYLRSVYQAGKTGLCKYAAKQRQLLEHLAVFVCVILVRHAPSSLAASMTPPHRQPFINSVTQVCACFAEFCIFYDNWTAYCL
tara:strand:+ start:135984 stop:136541 length:558 start_codon:yes stop_codon:yes gene_type:complete